MATRSLCEWTNLKWYAYSREWIYKSGPPVYISRSRRPPFVLLYMKRGRPVIHMAHIFSCKIVLGPLQTTQSPRSSSVFYIARAPARRSVVKRQGPA